MMVGDPKQLPATVLSRSFSKTNYEISMFERLQRAGYPVTVLNTQMSVLLTPGLYRMHPEIRRFPSAHFYDNQLIDGLLEGSRKARFHSEWCFAPYVFFDGVEGRHRIGSFNPLCNDAEADVAQYLSGFATKIIIRSGPNCELKGVSVETTCIKCRSKCSSCLGLGRRIGIWHVGYGR